MSEIEIPWDEIDRANADIRKRGARRVLLQLPEGLKRKAKELCERIERASGAVVYLQGESTFGACDSGHGFQRLGVDAVVHIGHAPIPEIMHPVEGCSGYLSPPECPDVPYHFIELHLPGNYRELAYTIEAVLSENEPVVRDVVLAAPVQYVHLLMVLGHVLEEVDIDAHFREGDARIAHPGQVLGCNFSSVRNSLREIDWYREPLEKVPIVFVGTGNFHPLGLALSTGEPVIVADPVTGKVHLVDTERFLRQRHAAIAAAREASTFAVLVSTKIGQHRESLAGHILSLLREHGKDAFIIAMDHIDPNALRYLGVDVLVNTACPRIAIDDHGRFVESGLTILTPPELEIVLGIREWDRYVMDEIVEGQ